MSEELIEVDKDVALYIKLRDFKAEVESKHKLNVAKIDEKMEEIENRLMTFLNITKQQSGSTANGTFFKRTTTRSKVSDRDVFFDFVKQEDMFNFLENRVNNTAVTEYVEAHGKVPPGVSVERIVKLSINRPK